MRRFTTRSLAGLLLLLAGCESGSVASPDPTSEDSGGLAPGITVPAAANGNSGWETDVLVEESVYPNSCTGELATFTFTGSMKVQQVGGMYQLVAHGTVETSDGWTGRFNRNFVIIDDKVFIIRFHDMEVQADPSGPKQVFSVGMGHETLAGGVTHDYFEQFGGSGCVGKPGP